MSHQSADALTKIKKARLSLLFNQPFWGNLVMALPLQEENTWCTTAAVDGRHIYWNREFFSGLTVDEIIFVLAHEICHVVYAHLGRRNHRDPMLWNMGTDYVINGMLTQEKLGTMPTKPVIIKDGEHKGSQRVGLYDAKYLGWTSEAVYDDLIKRGVQKQLTLDVHLELGKDGQNRAGQDAMKGQGIPIEVSEEDLKQIQEELKSKVLQAAQAAQAAGKLPAAVARLIDGLVEPKINWRDYIRECIQSQLTADYAYHRPNRRHHGSDVIFPSLLREEQIDVEVSIDQSGSISPEMAMDFLSEVYGITEQYSSYRIAVSTFDTRLYNRQVFTEENGEDMLSYEPKGGGGTRIPVVFEYLKKHDINPKLLIIFTDLEDNSHGDPNYCNTLWLINNPYNKNIVPEFGSWVRYERDQGVVETGSV
jgi:predicted metal-dependent peptidase